MFTIAEHRLLSAGDHWRPPECMDVYPEETSFTVPEIRRWCHHRVDSVIESSLREIIESKTFALINLSLNFCETTIYDSKVFLNHLVALH